MSTKVEFTIPYPTDKRLYKYWMKQYSLNAIYLGKHWSKRREDAEYWHYLTIAQINQQIPKAKMYEKPVRVTMYWNDTLDIDNHAYMGKMIVDALKGRLIQDDSKKYVKSVTHEFHEGNILVVIEEN